MKPSDVVRNQIEHRETPEVPYTLPMEESVRERLDDYYGGEQWRERLKPYILGVSAVDTNPREPVDGAHVRDPYGGIWRTDRRPWHLVRPPLEEPSFRGYDFPEPEEFFRPESKEQAYRTCEENSDQFLIGHLGWGLFERSWNLRAQVRHLCREMSRGGGYILAPAKPLQPETPTENAVAVVESFCEEARMRNEEGGNPNEE